MKTNSSQRLQTTAHKVNEVWKPGVRGYHQATGALILAQDTCRFLLQLRSKTSSEPLTYGQFGGSVDGNEEIHQALRREIQEETGYKGPLKAYPLTPSNRLPAANSAESKEHSFVYYNYLAVVPKEFEVCLPGEFADESAGHVWFDYPDFPSPLHPGLEELLKDQWSLRTIEIHLNKYLELKHGKAY